MPLRHDLLVVVRRVPRAQETNTPAVALRRLVSRLGDFWWLLAGVAALVLGMVGLARAEAKGAVVVLLLGLVAIAVALFVGPRRMASRTIGRRIGLVLEYAAFCALWIAVALSHRPPVDNDGPWFDSGGIVLGAVVLVAGVGIGVGWVEARCLLRSGLPSALTAVAVIAIYTALASTTAFAGVTFLTSFNDNSPVTRGEWNGAWIYFGALITIPALVTPTAMSLRQINR
jgi:hypothetical protein